MDLFVWIILIALAIVLFIAIIYNKFGNAGNPAASSGFADFQNQDKRNAMETVVEMKAGKKQFGQTTDEDK